MRVLTGEKWSGRARQNYFGRKNDCDARNFSFPLLFVEMILWDHQRSSMVLRNCSMGGRRVAEARRPTLFPTYGAPATFDVDALRTQEQSTGPRVRQRTSECTAAIVALVTNIILLLVSGVTGAVIIHAHIISAREARRALDAANQTAPDPHVAHAIDIVRRRLNGARRSTGAR